jgi:hypothetical protein
MSDHFSIYPVVFFSQGCILVPSSRTKKHVPLQVLVSQGSVEETFMVLCRKDWRYPKDTVLDLVALRRGRCLRVVGEMWNDMLDGKKSSDGLMDDFVGVRVSDEHHGPLYYVESGCHFRSGPLRLKRCSLRVGRRSSDAKPNGY